MNTNPLVSIIIPTYNRANLITETLNSILAQTYSNWECIIVDDVSNDNTDEIVHSYVEKDKRFQYHKRPNGYKSGGNGARNYGFELSKGEYINWFDSDDIMHPEKLEKQISGLLEFDANFSVCQTLVFEEKIENILGLRHEKIVSKEPLFDFITHKIIFLTQAPIFKRTFLELHQLLFDEELKAAQEWEFICRVLFFSPDYLTDDLPFVYIRKHQDSITYGSDKEMRQWNYYLARKKVFYFLKNKDFSEREIFKYFKEYFANQLNKFLLVRSVFKSFSIYNQTIRKDKSFTDNLKIVIFMCFVLITKKGYRFRTILN